MARLKPLVPALVYTGLALSILLPMLGPGYIFALDMAFTPKLPLPDTMSSSYLFHATLHYLNLVLPSQIIQKLLLLAILLLCGLGMHRLVRYIQTARQQPRAYDEWTCYVAGALYMVNPFTYGRFMAGQYAVLLGYALLPFVVRAVVQFLTVPAFERMLAATGWIIVVSIVSVHTLGLVAIFGLVGLAICAWRYRDNATIVKNIGLQGLVGSGIFVLASAYWLIPLLAGQSVQGQAVRQFGAGDQAAFATAGEGVAGQLGNVLQLQGFWAEGQGLFLLPQEQLPGWLLVVLGLWMLAGVGLYFLWKRQRVLAALLAGSALVAIVIALAGLPNIAALAGFREPHKFVGLVALAYALFAGFGASTVLQWAERRRRPVVLSLLALLIVLIPPLLTPTMFWGFGGQLAPRQYPAEWHRLNTRLNQDPEECRVLFLPWHQYMHFAFAGRVIVNPAEDFFDKPTLTSNELEFNGAAPTFPSADKSRLTQTILPAAAGRSDLGAQLLPLNIKYVVLAKTYDYKTYEYLNKQTDLQLIDENDNFAIYRSLAYE